MLRLPTALSQSVRKRFGNNCTCNTSSESDEDGEEEYDDLFEANQDIFAFTDMAQTLAIDAQPTIAEEDDDEAE